LPSVPVVLLIPVAIWPPVLTIPAINLPPVSTTDTGGAPLAANISATEKIRNGRNGLLRGLGETDS
jgi:hypothetical protein